MTEDITDRLKALITHVRNLKKKSNEGAILLIEDEVFIKPTWLISKHRIALRERVPGHTFEHTLWEYGDMPEETEAWLRANVRVLVDAT